MVFEWILRLFIAATAGTLIGYERHNRAKEAGIRTHAIVALGACLLMIISKYGFEGMEKYDAARIAAQVVSGVGFLGAGLIFVRHDTIQGLTTAAGVWATSAIGMCVGSGMYLLGIVATFMVVVVQHFFRHIFKEKTAPHTTFRLRIHMNENGTIGDAVKALTSVGYFNNENHLYAEDNGWLLETEIYTLQNVEPKKLLEKLKNSENITGAEITAL